VLVAAAVAWLWSKYGHRVNLAQFFQVTAIFLSVFVIQLFVYGFHELTEANVVPYSEELHWATEPYGPDGRYGVGVGSAVGRREYMGHNQNPQDHQAVDWAVYQCVNGCVHVRLQHVTLTFSPCEFTQLAHCSTDSSRALPPGLRI